MWFVLGGVYFTESSDKLLEGYFTDKQTKA